MKLILALALGAAAYTPTTPALRGTEGRRLEALELLSPEDTAAAEAQQATQRASALAEAMAQLKEAQEMMAKAEALKTAAAAPAEPAALPAAEPTVAAPAEPVAAPAEPVAAPAAPAAAEGWEAQFKALEAAKQAAEAAEAPAEPVAESAETTAEATAGEPAAAEPATAEPAAEEATVEAPAAATEAEPAAMARIATDVAALAAAPNPAVAAEVAELVKKLQAELKEESALLAALAAKLDAMRGGSTTPVERLAVEAPTETETVKAVAAGAAPNALTVATWNVAAINNNPFEYWIHSDDANYNTLMADVQKFISAPGEADVRVSKVFTDAMWEELKAKMKGVGWAGVDDVDDLWQDDYRRRKIISGFLKDDVLSKKRLASMPDRVTTTIRSIDGKVMRPTVINCYEKEFTTLAD